MEAAASIAGLASLAGLALQLGEVALKLNRLRQRFRDVPKSLERIGLEVTALELHIQELQRCVQRSNGMVAFQHDTAIQMCNGSIQRILHLIDAFEKNLKRSEAYGRLSVLLKDSEIKELFQELEREKSSLILATQILTEYISYPKDSRAHR
jgi:hypothetical protein